MQPDTIGILVVLTGLMVLGIRLLAGLPPVIPHNEEYREDRRS